MAVHFLKLFTPIINSSGHSVAFFPYQVKKPCCNTFYSERNDIQLDQRVFQILEVLHHIFLYLLHLFFTIEKTASLTKTKTPKKARTPQNLKRSATVVTHLVQRKSECIVYFCISNLVRILFHHEHLSPPSSDRPRLTSIIVRVRERFSRFFICILYICPPLNKHCIKGVEKCVPGCMDRFQKKQVIVLFIPDIESSYILQTPSKITTNRALQRRSFL